MKRVSILLTVLILMTVLVVAVRAEEPKAPEDAPEELPQGKEAFLEPIDRPDLLAYMGKLRRALSQYEEPPPSTPDITALSDAWSSILRPRIGSMVRRVEKWLAPDRWFIPEGDATPAGIRPDQWRAFTRDMAALVSQLAGAYKQYDRVKLKPKRRVVGVAPFRYGHGYSRYRVSHWGYGWPVHYGGIVDRQAAGSALGQWDSASYWHLLNRFSYAWDWRWAYRARWYEHWRDRERATKQLFEDLRSYLDGTRDSLGETLLGLQAFVAALQNAEEERLLEACIPCKTKDETLTKMAETALAAMEKTRIKAERYQGRSTSGYGSLLRKWLRSQIAADRVLNIAIEEEAAAKEAAAEEASAEEVATEK